MKAIVGLGNPGPQYELTRHNVGFLAIDRLIDEWRASDPTKKADALIAEASWRGEKILLIKPTTYMNASGKAVGPLFHFLKLAPTDLTVIHDELDLPPFRIKIKAGGGTAGHNGLKSLDQHLGSDNSGYYRIRIGIGKPPPSSRGVDYVLDPFPDEELPKVDELLAKVVEAAGMLVEGRLLEAMNQFNRSEEEDS